MPTPLVTVVIPSFNQGQFLEKTLESVFQQDLRMEVFVLDGGSTDGSVDIIERWSSKLAGWRSYRDNGQSAAINEGVMLGKAPYVTWLNSDDYWLPEKIKSLIKALELNPESPMAYGRVYNYDEVTGKFSNVWVEEFDPSRLKKRCTISQPATLIRRDAWIEVGGLDPNLKMAMDYDLWWRLYKGYGAPIYMNEFIAVNRQHQDTKTQSQRFSHYKEAMGVVKKHTGSVPLKWWLYQPYAVWLKSILNWYQKH